ncbi:MULTISPECIES: sacsin N-terminal ATP-binding-like domain-containing protein [unclassified Microcoleus]|uniref:sacsin N-terminal ATP-binding-like domain-containing protein n=1 Tax=unclassified Microcoleus TaxID=2642155 RepID=UPI002FD40F7A
MPGYQPKQGTIINNIKSLLKERYKQGFPIIKEIIQNANDGQAKTLKFGISRGLIGTAENPIVHPLLTTPALFFLNDGVFKTSDREAISCFGIDANAGDKGKIGKFGLGQKSIFHFCEAFFYIARSKDIPNGCGDFINPWATPDGKDKKRPEWIELNEVDHEDLKKYLIAHKLIKDTDNQYFLLWVPFRQKPLDERSILANYYNDENSIQDSLPNDMDIKIGELLPLLRHLTDIQYWVEDETRKLQQKFNVCLDYSVPLERFIYPNNDAILSGEHPIKGKVTVSKQTIAFAGIERILPAEDFAFLLGQDADKTSEKFWESLQQSRCWSKRLSINEDGDEEFIPDKSIPHCGVVFTQKLSDTSRSAKLTLQWAVFLPLASDETTSNEEERAAHQQIDCDGEQDYTIFLHGYFFLDSGRKYIEGLQNIDRESIAHPPQNEDDMVWQWNYLLATKGTLRLVLPSLADFVKTHRLSDTAVSHLCQGLLKSHLFQGKVFRQSIYFEYQWLFRTNPLIYQWQLIGLDATVRSLPSIPSKSIWDAFPQLEKLAEQYCLTVEGKPNLLAVKDTTTWKSHEICAIIDSLEPSNIFSNIDNLSFLQAFLSQCQQEIKVINDEKVQVSLRELLHKAFAELGIAQLQKDKILPCVKKLLALVLPESRYAIAKFAADEQSVHSILKKLYALNLDLLIVYATFELDPRLFSQAKLNPQQGVKILTCLSNIFQEEPLTRKVSEELIPRVLNGFDKPETVLNHLPNTPLFLGYNSRDEKSYRYTYSELQVQAKNYFFNGSSTTQIARALRQALPDCDLIFIDDRLTNILKKIPFFINIPKCDRNSCLQLLAKQPNLAIPEQRINLLKELIRYV